MSIDSILLIKKIYYLGTQLFLVNKYKQYKQIVQEELFCSKVSITQLKHLFSEIHMFKRECINSNIDKPTKMFAMYVFRKF